MRHWYLYILATLLTFNVAACSDDAMDVSLSTKGTEVYVSVTLNVNGGTNEPHTRATITPEKVGDDGQPIISMGDATANEESIDPNDVDILLFTRGTGNGGNGTFVARVNLIHSWMGQGDVTDDADRSYQYQIWGYVENKDITLDTEYQMMTICNMGKSDGGYTYTTLTDGTTIYNSSYDEASLKGKTRDEVIQMLIFRNYNANFTQALIAGNARIPMWGIKSVIIKKEYNNFSMDVLRAMAKVRVTLDDNLYDKGFRFTWAGMTKVNTCGYIAAQEGMAITTNAEGITTAYNSTSSTPIFKSCTPENPVLIAENIGFHQLVEHKSHIIYLPEFSNQGITGTNDEGYSLTSAIRLQIKYIYHLGNGQEDWNYDLTFNGKYPQLYFSDYSVNPSPSASEWDILRNDFYDYTITRIESGMQVNLEVADWFKYTHPGVSM